MNPIVRNILAVVAGLVVGSIINGSLISIGPSIIPMPEGVTMENLAEGMKQFEAKHFLMPFLAHALGTLAGAFTVVKIAVSHQMKFALGIACLFLVGGIAAVNMLPAPLWFEVTDLVLAYLPMGWLGGRLAGAGTRS